MNLKVLKAYRIMGDVTKKDMAEILGISIVAYNNKEWGRVQFTLSEAKKIADFFNKTIEEVFYAEDIKTKS